MMGLVGAIRFTIIERERERGKRILQEIFVLCLRN